MSVEERGGVGQAKRGTPAPSVLKCLQLSSMLPFPSLVLATSGPHRSVGGADRQEVVGLDTHGAVMSNAEDTRSLYRRATEGRVRDMVWIS